MPNCGENTDRRISDKMLIESIKVVLTSHTSLSQLEINGDLKPAPTIYDIVRKPTKIAVVEISNRLNVVIRATIGNATDSLSPA